MLQTKLSIKIILTFTTTLYWSFNTSLQRHRNPQRAEDNDGCQRPGPPHGGGSSPSTILRASDPRAPIYFPDLAEHWLRKHLERKGRACWALKKQDIRDGTPKRGRQVSRIKKDSSKRKERRKVCGFGSMEMLNLTRSRFQVQEKREAVGR
nr:uncharacterized protein LOC127312869 [Lolium perenne]XP_051199374.1 uncharacterized protein LOC127312869 [Lolium perenne]XP_051199375.1 uncharacterized protein LOC127312869 [Lolium perenne]XP_051199376.1 uncharacterized protein LOC127312869 [Lolium perenne]XP_051199377.1 uncharacterized protein LOC127312869 [Lolium perenne]